MNDTYLNFNDSSTPSLNESIWAFERNIPNYFFAVVLAIILAAAAGWNAFVIIVMSWKKMILKESSTVLLFSLAIVDLFGSISIVPFYIATLLQGGWKFGNTDYTRGIACSAVGFSLAVFVSLSFHLVALIALDRMLMILLVLQYPRYIKPWVAWLFVLVIFIIGILVSFPPFIGLGEYYFSPYFGGCLFRWDGEPEYLSLYVGEHLIPITANVVTSLVTFFYVKKFLRKVERRQSQWSINPNAVMNRHRTKQRTTTKIFIVLLVTQVVCFFPAMITALAGVALGNFDQIPTAVYQLCFILLMSNTAANPLIQSFFRKEIRDILINLFRKICKRKRKVEVNNSASSDNSGQVAPLTAISEAPTNAPFAKIVIVPSNNDETILSSSHSGSFSSEGFDEKSHIKRVSRVSFHLKPITTNDDRSTTHINDNEEDTNSSSSRSELHVTENGSCPITK